MVRLASRRCAWRPPVRVVIIFCTLTAVLSAWGSQIQVLGLKWSPTGSSLAILTADPYGQCDLMIWRDPGGTRRIATYNQVVTLLGWTPDGKSVIVEICGKAIEVVGVDTKSVHRLPIPEGVVPIASDGDSLYYIRYTDSGDVGVLMKRGHAQETALVVLPSGTRPSGELSPDSQYLALRRSLKTEKGWITEIWIVSREGESERAAVVNSSFVLMQWHPASPALLLSYPDLKDKWTLSIAVRAEDGTWCIIKHFTSVDSPGQWDKAGNLYVMSPRGLHYLKSGSPSAPLISWQPSAEPSLWAVSPTGRLLARSPGDRDAVSVTPLP